MISAVPYYYLSIIYRINIIYNEDAAVVLYVPVLNNLIPFELIYKKICFGAAG